MTQIRISDTFTALYTPFTPDGAIDLEAFTALCERVAAAGSGLVPCGTTGETPALTADEYTQLVQRAVEVAAGRVPVYAGTGSSATAQTIATTQHAESLGVDGALVVTPAYNRPPQRALLHHYRALAKETKLPILLYNVPSRTGCNMLPETTLTLAADPQFVGVKEASGDLNQVDTILAQAPADFGVLSGDDGLTYPMMSLGAHGLVSVAGNIAPTEVTQLVRLLTEGAYAEALRLHRRLSPLFAGLFLTTNPIGVKRAAALLGHAREHLRLPLSADALEPEMEATLKQAMVGAGLL